MTTISSQNGSLVASRPPGDVAVSEPPQSSSRPRASVSRRTDAEAAAKAAKAKARRMHRISTVRQRQGVSLRSVARQMRIDVRRLRAQEDESADLMLSTLYQWQKVLDVPISELLVETNDPLSPVILQRARMVKIMKTVAAILERSESKGIRRLAEMLTEQLTELMPELKDISPWHSVGQRRTAHELGRAAERRLPDDFFIE
jgi:transcriptional regulator with XRE-family HTH domain